MNSFCSSFLPQHHVLGIVRDRKISRIRTSGTTLWTWFSDTLVVAADVWSATSPTSWMVATKEPAIPDWSRRPGHYLQPETASFSSPAALAHQLTKRCTDNGDDGCMPGAGEYPASAVSRFRIPSHADAFSGHSSCAPGPMTWLSLLRFRSNLHFTRLN